MSPASPRKIEKRWDSTCLPAPSPLALLRGLRRYVCGRAHLLPPPCPELQEREKSNLLALSDTKHSLGKNLSLLSSCNYFLLPFRDPDFLSSPSYQIIKDSEPLKLALGGGWGAVALEFSVRPSLPPLTSHDKHGDPPFSCTRRRDPSTCCTLAPRPVYLRAPGPRTQP